MISREWEADAKGMLVTEFTPRESLDGVFAMHVLVDIVAGAGPSVPGGYSYGSVFSVVATVDTTVLGEVPIGEVNWWEPMFGNNSGDYTRPAIWDDCSSEGIEVFARSCISVGPQGPVDKTVDAVVSGTTGGGLFKSTTRWIVCSVYSFKRTNCAHLYVRGTTRPRTA
jgi:hypothetical protein